MKIIFVALLVLFCGISLIDARTVGIPGENATIEVPDGWTDGMAAGTALPPGNTLLYSAMDPQKRSELIVASEPNNRNLSINEIDNDAVEKRIVSSVEVGGASAFLNSRSLLTINGVPAYLVCFNLEGRSLPAFGRRYIIAANKKFYKIIVVSLNGGLDSELKEIAMSFQFTSPPDLPTDSQPSDSSSLPVNAQAGNAPSLPANSQTSGSSNLPVNSPAGNSPSLPADSQTSKSASPGSGKLISPGNFAGLVFLVLLVVLLVMIVRRLGESGILKMLFRYLGFLLIVFICGFIFMSFWIVHDGSQDHYDSADAAFVPGYAEIKNGVLAPELTARLDRAKQILDQGKITYIIVSAVTPSGEDDEAQAMARYLQAHDVSVGSILQDHPGDNAGESVESVSKIMKAQEIHSLLLIDDYYRLVHLKIRFVHGGEKELAQAHIGEWKQDDARKVMNEDIAIYKDVYDWYVVPDSKEFGKKAWSEAQEIKASVGAEVDTLQKK